MIKISVIGLLLILCTLMGYAQEIIYIPNPDSIDEPIVSDSTIGRAYSQENLQNSTQENLTIYLEKAHKLKRRGGIISIVGPVTSLAGIGLAIAAYSGGTGGEFAAGTLMFLGGIITTAVGLPVLIIGSIRVNKVENALKTPTGASLNIAPNFVFNNKTQNIHPGVTLRIRF